MDEFEFLGKTISKPSRQLDSFPAPPVAHVQFVSEEFTTLCPVTGQPDFNKITITYGPKELCIESKSLKLYLWSFREEGAFCEALAAMIAQDIAEAIVPWWVAVKIDQNVRGGLALTVEARIDAGDH